MDITYLISVYWQPVAAVATLIASLVMLYFASKFASKADLLKIEQQQAEQRATLSTHAEQIERIGKFDDHDQRLLVLERHIADSPTRAELQESISELGKEFEGVKATVEGLQTHLSSQLNSLEKDVRLVIDKLIPSGRS